MFLSLSLSLCLCVVSCSLWFRSLSRLSVRHNISLEPHNSTPMYLLVDALASAYRLASSLTRSSVEIPLSRPATPQRTSNPLPSTRIKPTLLKVHQTLPPQSTSKPLLNAHPQDPDLKSLARFLSLSLFFFVYYMYPVRRVCCLVYSVCRGFLFSLSISPSVSLSPSCLVVQARMRGLSCCRKRQSPGDP